MSKHTFLLVVAGLLCTAVHGASLPIPGNGHTSQDLFYKESRAWRIHKACKISGWTAFSVGAPMMIAGFVGDVLANYERLSYKSYNPAFRIVGCVGTGLTAACIPLFVLANRHKKAAQTGDVTVSLGSTTVRTVTTLGTLADKPALALQIRF